MINLTALNQVKTAKNITNTQPNGLRYSSYVQKPDSFEHTCPVNFTGSSNRMKQYGKTVEALKETGHNAQMSLDGQLASEGWAGKVADSVSVLWNSKNRAVLVQADINEYNKQVGELKESIKEKKFTQKFEEVFGVPYKQSNIIKYNEVSKQFKMAVTSKVMADMTNEKLGDALKEYTDNNGKLEDKVERIVVPYPTTGCPPIIYHTTSKETTFKKMENSLVSLVGSQENLDHILNTSGVNTEKVSMEEKYNAYGIMAKFLVDTSNETAKNVSQGKTIKELKQEYDDAYDKAYGTKNDIQTRVDKYIRSQEIGAAAVRGATRSALSALVLLAAPEAGFARIVTKATTTMGIKILVDGSDKLSSEKENALDAKTFKNLVRSASISGAEKLATGVLNTFIPGLDTGCEILDEVLSQGKSVAIDTSVGMVGEKIKKGNWATNQIVPRMLISLLFKNLNPDNDFVGDLLDATKGGINQAMKSSTRGVDITKSFVEGTKQLLKDVKVSKEHAKSLSELKEISEKNPEEFAKIMFSALQQMAKEQGKNNQVD